MVFYQVNQLLRQFRSLKLVRRCSQMEETLKKLKVLFPLESRSLIKVSGVDASPFLQGLLTNDMSHFDQGAKSMYALFLNNKGRILYDTLIHKWGDDSSFLVECDKKVLPKLERHLNIYKLKRQITINDLSDALRVWVLIAPVYCIPDLAIDTESNFNIFKDPRLPELGHRVLASKTLDKQEILKTIGNDMIVADVEGGYKYIKYQLGVAEGAEDLPPGTVFPLEANCDYLHGVSFHKGCYLGQELLARVHFTGVVRKRIMPIVITEESPENINYNAPILDCTTNKEIGRVKGIVHDNAIGLVRIKEALGATNLKIGNYTAEVQKPQWWPIEAPKEKVNTIKTDEKEV